MQPGEEIVVELDRGKTLLITFVSFGEIDDDGFRTVFFKVNGQTRTVLIRDESIKVEKVQHQKIDKNNEKHIGAPLQGSLTEILVKKGDKVAKNQALFVIEAMKMETTVTANASGKVEEVLLQPGVMVFADDMVIRLE
jgi:pyruvate carboxylase